MYKFSQHLRRYQNDMVEIKHKQIYYTQDFCLATWYSLLDTKTPPTDKTLSPFMSKQPFIFVLNILPQGLIVKPAKAVRPFGNNDSPGRTDTSTT